MKEKIFGEGFYQLSTLYTGPGKPIPRGLLSLEQQRELLKNPQGDIDYAILAALSYVDEMLKTFAQQFFEFQRQTKPYQNLIPAASDTFEKMLFTVSELSHADKSYFALDLGHVNFEALVASEFDPKKFFWVVLQKKDGSIVGNVFITNQQITIYSDQPLLVTGKLISGKNVSLDSLTTYSMAEVCVQNVSVTHTQIYSTEFQIVPDAAMPASSTLSFQTSTLEVHCHQAFRVAAGAKMKVDNPSQIEAGRLIIERNSAAEFNADTRVMAERIDVHGDLAVRGELMGMTLGVDVHPGGHLHAYKNSLLVAQPHPAGVAQIFPKWAGVRFAGAVSNRGFTVYSRQTKFMPGSKTYVQGKTQFLGASKSGYVEIDRRAHVSYRGSIESATAFAWIDGPITESDLLNISYGRVEDPSLSETREEIARGAIPSALRAPVTKDAKDARSLIEITPPVKSEDRSSIAYRDFSKSSKPEEEKTSSHIRFSALYLKVSSKFKLQFSTLQLEGEEVDFSAQVEVGAWDENKFFAPLSVLIQAHTLQVSKAAITVPDGQVVLEASGPVLLSDTHIESERMEAKGLNLSFQGEVALTSGHIMMQAVRDVTVEKASTLSVHSPKPAALLCQNFQMRGGSKLEFDHLHIQAKQLMRLWRAELQGKSLSIESRILLAGLTLFSIDTVSVTGAVSVLLFCKVAVDRFCNQTLLNLSVSLYTPKTLALNARNALALLLATLNTGMSLAQLFVHDPVVQAALIATRFALNALPALANIVRLAADIHKASTEKIDEFAAIRLANQVKSLVFSLVNLGYGGATTVPEIQSFLSQHAPMLPSPDWGDALTTFSRLNDTLGQLATTLTASFNVSSFVDVSADAVLGFASSRTSLVSVAGGLNGALSSSRMGVAFADLPSYLDLAPTYSTDTGVLAYSAGAAPLPIGSHASRDLLFDSASPWDLSRQHSSVHAYQYVVQGEQHLRESSIETESLMVARGASMSMKNGSVKASHLDAASKASVLIEHSTAKIEDMQVADQASVVLRDSHATIAQLQDETGASVLIQHSVVEIDAAQVAKDAQMTVQGSHLTLGQLDVASGASAVLEGSEGTIAQIHDEAGGVILYLGSKFSTGTVQVDKDSSLALVNSEVEITRLQEDGRLTGDEGVLKLEDAKVGGQVGLREITLIVEGRLESEVDFGIGFNKHLSALKPDESGSRHSHHFFHHHSHPKQTPQDSKASSPIILENVSFTPQDNLSGHLSEDGRTIVYQPSAEAPGDVTLQDNSFVSIFNLAITTPKTITLVGDNSSDVALSLTATDGIKFQHAQSDFAGLTTDTTQLDIVGGKLSVRGDAYFSGGELTGEDAPQILVAGVIQGDLTHVKIQGKTTVTETTSTHESFLGLSTREERSVETTFENAQLVSGGGIDLHAKDKIQFIGVDASSEKDLTLTASEIVLDRMEGVDSHTKSHSTPISDHSREQTQEVESPSRLVAGKKLELDATKSLTNNASDFAGGEQTVIRSPEIKGSASVLTDTFTDRSTGLTSSLPSFHVQNPVTQVLHPGASIAELTGGINTAAATLDALRRQDGFSALSALTGINPTVSLKWGQKGVHFTTQHVGSGGIYTPNLTVIGLHADFSNNFAIKAQHTFIQLDSLTAGAAGLHSTLTTYSSGLEASMGLSGVAVFDAFHSGQTSAQLQWAGDAMDLGDLEWQVGKVTLDGVSPHVTHLSGRVDQFNSRAMLDISDQHGDAESLSSRGSVEWSQQSAHSETASTLMPFISDKPLSEISHDFSVGSLTLTGQTGVGITAQESHYVPIFEIKRSDSRSISLPLGDLLPSSGASPGSVFSLFHYQREHNDYRASRSDVLQVLQDTHHRSDMILPLYHPQAGAQLAKNIAWLTAPLYPKPLPMPTVRQKPLPHSKPPAAIKHTPRHSSPSESEIDIDLLQRYQVMDPLAPAFYIDWESSPDPPGDLPLTTHLQQLLMDDASEELSTGTQDSALAGFYIKSPYPVDEIETLYRGDARDPGQIFNEGMTARGSNSDLLSHALPPDAEDFFNDSLFISTSRCKDVAATFPRIPADTKSYIYVISSIRSTVNITEEIVKGVRAGSIDSDNFQVFISEKERAFTSRIFPHEIKGGWKVDITREKIPNIEDFSFSGEEWSLLSSIDELCNGYYQSIGEELSAINKPRYEYHRTIGEEFIPNPSFISPFSIHNLWDSLKIAGLSLTALGIGIDGLSLYREFQHSQQTGNYDNTYREGVRIGGGWVGAWNVGSVSARGGAVCAPLGPYGVAACGFTFGLAGSIVGYFGGSTIATKIYDVSRASDDVIFQHDSLQTLSQSPDIGEQASISQVIAQSFFFSKKVTETPKPGQIFLSDLEIPALLTR